MYIELLGVMSCEFNFQSLVKVAHARVSQDGLAGVTELGDPPFGIITRGMLK